MRHLELQYTGVIEVIANPYGDQADLDKLSMLASVRLKHEKSVEDVIAVKLSKLADDKVVKSLHIARQLDHEKIDALGNRIDKLLKSNLTLRDEGLKNEEDSHEIGLYFKREMEIKDEIIARLNEELIKRDTQLKFEAEKIRSKFDGNLNDLRLGTEQLISDLRAKLVASENDLRALEDYRKTKHAHDQKLLSLERILQEERESNALALHNQERNFIAQKAVTLRDLDKRKDLIRDGALQEAKEAMSIEARRVLADNNRMYDELKFLQTMATDIEAEKVLADRIFIVVLASGLRFQARFLTNYSISRKYRHFYSWSSIQSTGK